MILPVEGIYALLRIIGIDPSESLESAVQLIHAGIFVVQSEEVSVPELHPLVKRILQREPVDLSRLAPFSLLAELLPHEEQLLAGMPHHESISCPKIGEFVHGISGHLAQHGAFKMHHFIMGKYQNIVLCRIVAHGKGHLVMVVLAEIRIQLHIVAEVVHPSHVPLEGKTESVIFHIPRDLGPCR